MSRCPRGRPPKSRMYAVTDPQGICLIINIRHYDPETSLAERVGSEKDVESVRRLFGDVLHFDVRVSEDLTGGGIGECLTALVATSQEAMASHGSFVCFLMAHGSNEKVIGRDGVSQKMTDLTSLVDSRACPALANKPKVFIVHASRPPLPGADFNDGFGLPSTGRDDDDGDADGEEGRSLSFTNFHLRDTDFLVCFANTEGSPVFDDPQVGSAFLAAVCQLVQEEYQEEHLDDILTDVNHWLKSRPVSRHGRLHYYVPERVSSMTRKCFVDPDMADNGGGGV